MFRAKNLKKSLDIEEKRMLKYELLEGQPKN
jgi:hypothetical protein